MKMLKDIRWKRNLLHCKKLDNTYISIIWKFGVDLDKSYLIIFFYHFAIYY